MKNLRIRKALVIYKEESEHPRNHPFPTLEKIREVLEKNRISHRIIPRSRLKNVREYDLLITVGGDGTFLDASHYISPRQLLLGVNSNPALSHGAFCIATRKNFERVFLALLETRKPLSALNRLEVRINRRRVPILALNDVLFANRSPAGTSRYLLKVRGRKEEQKSSGVWISTAAGSTAAIHSAGGRISPKHSKEMQFVVREPFMKGKRLRLIRGKIQPSQSIRFLSAMSRAAVFLDGAHIHYDVKYGDEVEIRSAREPVYAVLKNA
jgi:NAD+ kinase